MSVTRADAAAWRPACDEYFDRFADGIWDEFCQLQLILPREKAEANPARGELVVGHAGVDGIHFCCRAGMEGIFAWYGIEGEHVLVAPDLATLVARWRDGSLTL